MMCLSGLRQLKVFFTILKLMPSDPALYFFAIEKNNNADFSSSFVRSLSCKK